MTRDSVVLTGEKGNENSGRRSVRVFTGGEEECDLERRFDKGIQARHDMIL